MAQVDDLNIAISELDVKVDALIAAGQAPDLQPSIDALRAIEAKIDAVLNP